MMLGKLAARSGMNIDGRFDVEDLWHLAERLGIRPNELIERAQAAIS